MFVGGDAGVEDGPPGTVAVRVRHDLPLFFEEVYGTHAQDVGYLLERVRVAAALMLQPPHRPRRKPGPLCQLALREPLVDP